MSKPTKIGIVILMLIVMFVVGLLVPNQFNDKGIVNNTKENVEKDNKKAEENKETSPQEMTDDEFSQKYNKQSDLGNEFVSKYYDYSFKEPDKSFNQSLDYLDKDYKDEKDFSNDTSKSLLYRDVKLNSITPVKEDSNKNEVTFQYDVDLKETVAKNSFDDKKAKKDDKYLKKIKTQENKKNKVITVTISLKDNKITSLGSNYL
ncbi:hypothetical protein O287_02679 [Staphylococcus aureus M0094]|jgi:hypothetical protein|uniref:hypothetical protein n=1 Tax=Staphylococcus TaxID=1279 RepID=UPI00025F4DE7|nr:MULTISPECIES: hypothetical protein [Staphylococcus]MDK3806189.1 hypothetical protein [Staphylococcus pseudintermedius]EIK02861.1 hypothetical protein MQC_02590 [Staphylococcus aureus subsp. aureus VRS2]EIK19733.1 hypothetical protein MQM_02647 [Staphylococcus aureus subsp. aureus VRS7]EUI21223.1 hypothetical protein Q113_02684 [Staphylococcus aureus M1439]EUS74963.1 hypothetical protein O274_02724 [Staphylococcus aureus M0076]